ncbi:enoyl-CoA hydratase/isomerase family protein [Verticiella sediminum]|uniref:Enoyl-CoA hydratase/isomerase family protein n=1 Tax=Verticiella sediminum TaxID=1247510 RepID=A0A556AMS1_9BURK|nr:enoyl-CoA hydratase/isomerase family protein [Verticiella sediminum]TSH94165.1 enoyl-CoA hydratase/isomerase family protein [Verticiella sediminum]
MRDEDADLAIAQEGEVAVIEMRRGPHNYFDEPFMARLADACEALDAEPACRAIVLAAEGRSFCAGANFGSGERRGRPGALYAHGLRLFRLATPLVAAVHGPAIGGGLGLALAADFRIACAEARFSANFNRLGFHPGFGMSVTLPRVVGVQHAARLLYTGCRIGGDEALRIGLVDALVEPGRVRTEALAWARDIAASAPLAVRDTRATLRAGLADAVAAALQREADLQARHFATSDFREGVAAMAERRLPVFRGE